MVRVAKADLENKSGLTFINGILYFGIIDSHEHAGQWVMEGPVLAAYEGARAQAHGAQHIILGPRGVEVIGGGLQGQGRTKQLCFHREQGCSRTQKRSWEVVANKSLDGVEGVR